MANRYWVGNSGNISDTAHWSATSGGAGGAALPTSVDNIYFDANSFTLAGQTVNMDNNLSCLDMSWVGVTNTPTFAGSTGNIQSYGSVTFVSGMIVTFTSFFNFNGAAVRTLTTAGLSFTNGFGMQGAGGTVTLQDNLTTSSSVSCTSGTLNTNGKTVTCRDFTFSGATTRTVTLGSSTINVSRNFTATTTTNLTFTANTATINISSPSAQVTFAGGGLTYYYVKLLGLFIITGSNTFNTLEFLPTAVANRFYITSGTTQTITNLISNGTNANPNTITSTSPGVAATIVLPASRFLLRHTTLQDITVTGAVSVTNIGGINTSNNTGITFVARFEIGRIKNDGSFNWYNTSTGLVTKVSG